MRQHYKEYKQNLNLNNGLIHEDKNSMVDKEINSIIITNKLIDISEQSERIAICKIEYLKLFYK